MLLFPRWIKQYLFIKAHARTDIRLKAEGPFSFTDRSPFAPPSVPFSQTIDSPIVAVSHDVISQNIHGKFAEYSQTAATIYAGTLAGSGLAAPLSPSVRSLAVSPIGS
jgi:hypothetical protein